MPTPSAPQQCGINVTDEIYIKLKITLVGTLMSLPTQALETVYI